MFFFEGLLSIHGFTCHQSDCILASESARTAVFDQIKGYPSTRGRNFPSRSVDIRLWKIHSLLLAVKFEGEKRFEHSPNAV